MGGGGSKQESTSKVVTNLVTKICMKQTIDCVSAVISEQEVNIRGGINNSVIDEISTTQELTVKMNCKLDAETIEKLQDEISNELKKEAKQASVAIMGALNSLVGEKNTNRLDTYIESQVEKSINKEFLTKVSSLVNNRQSINIDGGITDSIIGKIKADQKATVIQDAFSKVFATTEAMNVLKNIDAQVAEQIQKNPVSEIIDSVGGVVEKGFDGAASLLSTVNIILLIAAVFICVLVYFLKDTIVSLLPFPVMKAAIAKAASQKLNVPDNMVTVDAQPVTQEQPITVKPPVPSRNPITVTPSQVPPTQNNPEDIAA